MFTGQTDIGISSNEKKVNPTPNVLEYLNRQGNYKGDVVAFTSWDVFPYILNRVRSRIKMNSGYENMREDNGIQSLVNKVENEEVYNKTGTRQDELTFVTAKEYIRRFQPSIVYLGFGETDEMAHKARYDLYLEKATEVDNMIGELWHWVQSTPGYKNTQHLSLQQTTEGGRAPQTGRIMDFL
jgi:hypothetical protein